MTDITQREETELIWPAPRRQSLSTRASQILKRYILVEQLPPGHRLPSERRLADWLNVSRMVLREAILQLIGEGILYRPSPHALCVADFDRMQLASDSSVLGDEDAEGRELVELRVFIEIGAIEEIVKRATEKHLGEIEHWVVEGEQRVAAREPSYRADARFHAALLRALGNRPIDGFLPLIEENLRRDLLLDPHQLTEVGTSADYRSVIQHRQIFEAIRARDVEAARRLMRDHLTPYLDRERSPVVVEGGFDEGTHAR